MGRILRTHVVGGGSKNKCERDPAKGMLFHPENDQDRLLQSLKAGVTTEKKKIVRLENCGDITLRLSNWGLNKEEQKPLSLTMV